MGKIILASASPRRQEILNQMGIEYDIMPQDVDEAFKGLPPVDEAARIAEKKVRACLDSVKNCSDEWILGADTFVVLGDEYLGKPSNRSEARRMLQMLSGQTHQVITGLALNVPDQGIKTASSITDVRFSPMSESEIEWYLNQNEWLGVAASYRIQEKGALFISSVRGSYSNVMGLPINAFYGMLVSHKFNFRT